MPAPDLRTLALVLLLAFAAAPATADTWRGLDAGPFPGHPRDAAAAFLDHERAALGLDGIDLDHRRDVTWRGRTAVHWQQLHGGLPVVGAEVVVRVSPAGRVVMVGSSARAGLRAPVVPTLDPADALTIARGAVFGALPGAARGQLAVLPTAGGGRLAYRVLVETAHPPALWQVTLDAHDGAVLDASDLRLFAEGNAYEHNPANSDVIAVTLTDLEGDEASMIGAYAQVRTTVFEGDTATTAFLAEADPDGDFFYEPEEPAVDDAFAEVHTYHHVTTLSRYFEDVHGHAFDGPALVTTNFRYADDGTFNNAYFTNNLTGDTLLVFGQGSIDFAYDADVVAHEFGHSVIQSVTQMLFDGLMTYDEYGWNIAPGALHEGMADYWSASYHGDPVMGEYMASLGATRDLENDHACPSHVIGEPHEDGKIVGGMAWAIREILGRETADAVFYGAMGQLTPTPSFQDYGDAVAQAVEELVADGELDEDTAAEVIDVLEERGMLLCGRSMVLEDEVPQTVMLPGAQLIAEELCELARNLGAVFSTHYQYAIEIPAAEEGPVESVELTLEFERVDGQALGADDLQYDLYLREDELVTYDFEYLNLVVYELALPHADSYDIAFEDQDDALQLQLELDGEMPLENGTTYYLGMTQMNCPNVNMTVTADVVLGDPPADDDDDTTDEGDDDDDTDGGCECGVAPASAAPGLVAALVLAGALLRRRFRV